MSQTLLFPIPLAGLKNGEGKGSRKWKRRREDRETGGKERKEQDLGENSNSSM